MAIRCFIIITCITLLPACSRRHDALPNRLPKRDVEHKLSVPVRDSATLVRERMFADVKRGWTLQQVRRRLSGLWKTKRIQGSDYAGAFAQDVYRWQIVSGLAGIIYVLVSGESDTNQVVEHTELFQQIWETSAADTRGNIPRKH